MAPRARSQKHSTDISALLRTLVAWRLRNSAAIAIAFACFTLRIKETLTVTAFDADETDKNDFFVTML